MEETRINKEKQENNGLSFINIQPNKLKRVKPWSDKTEQMTWEGRTEPFSKLKGINSHTWNWWDTIQHRTRPQPNQRSQSSLYLQKHRDFSWKKPNRVSIPRVCLMNSYKSKTASFPQHVWFPDMFLDSSFPRVNTGPQVRSSLDGSLHSCEVRFWEVDLLGLLPFQVKDILKMKPGISFTLKSDRATDGYFWPHEASEASCQFDVGASLSSHGTAWEIPPTGNLCSKVLLVNRSGWLVLWKQSVYQSVKSFVTET